MLSERLRDRLPKPGFWTLTVGLALLVTPSVGLLAAELRDPKAETERLAREADSALRADLLDHGLTPLVTGASIPLGLRGVEVLVPRKELRLESGVATLTGRAPGRAATQAALVTLTHELSRYPSELLARARLKRLLLCSGLREGNDAIPSLPNFHGTLIVDVDADSPFLRRLLHHELFHFVDYSDDDQLTRDPAWQALNDPYFVYGSGGRFAREPGAGRFTAEFPGFVSRYAMSALEEDKAETFALRMSDPARFAGLVAADPVLRAKAAAVDAQLLALSPSFAAVR